MNCGFSKFLSLVLFVFLPHLLFARFPDTIKPAPELTFDVPIDDTIEALRSNRLWNRPRNWNNNDWNLWEMDEDDLYFSRVFRNHPYDPNLLINRVNRRIQILENWKVVLVSLGVDLETIDQLLLNPEIHDAHERYEDPCLQLMRWVMEDPQIVVHLTAEALNDEDGHIFTLPLYKYAHYLVQHQLVEAFKIAVNERVR